jgi:Spy/CpxP family protein refolding chaperone
MPAVKGCRGGTIMNTRIIRAFTVLWTVALVFSATAAFARPYGSGRHGDKTEARGDHGGRKMKEMMRELDLTAEQRDQMRHERVENREIMKKLEEDIMEKHRQLRDELEKPDTDTGKVQVLSSGIKALMGQEVDNRIAGILKTKELLTPEQFAKFQSRIKKRHHEMKKKKGSRRAAGEAI